jgi:hypothetical protein
VKSLKDGAPALAVAPDEEYMARLPGSRPRLETLVGVAPAAPIVMGHPDGVRSPRDTVPSAPAPAEAWHEPPVSRVQPAREPRPELPRSPMASKHTLDAIAISAESAAVAGAPRRKNRAALLGAFAVLAVLAFVGARRVSRPSHVLAADAPFLAPVDLPSVTPATLADPSPDEVIAVARATGSARAHTSNAKPPRKNPARHKHAPKSPRAALP